MRSFSGRLQLFSRTVRKSYLQDVRFEFVIVGVEYRIVIIRSTSLIASVTAEKGHKQSPAWAIIHKWRQNYIRRPLTSRNVQIHLEGTRRDTQD